MSSTENSSTENLREEAATAASAPEATVQAAEEDVEGHFSFTPNHHLDENDARSEGTPFSPSKTDTK